MVFEYVRQLLCERFACDEEDVELPVSLDDLNLAPYEREELAMALQDRFGTEIADEEMDSWESVEDVVATVEDRL